MDSERFDRVARAWSRQEPRRTALSVLAGGLVGFADLGASAAKGKKNKNKNKNNKNKNKNRQPTEPPAPPAPPPASPPPPPPAPVARPDAACLFRAFNSAQLSDRLAQTFLALSSGQLTSASVWRYGSDAGADLRLEVWSVFPSGVPKAVLTGTTITDQPAPGPVTGTFATPAAVVAGERYALVITSAVGTFVTLRCDYDNPCPDGIAFNGRDGSFAPRPTIDLRFETVVAA